MNVNMDLAKTFKRDAANRIKGIARAGRLLAKEENIAEAGKNPYGPGYKLVDKDGKQLSVGHKFKFTSHHEGSKPEHHEITGWQSGAQRGNSSSSGRVAVKVGRGKNAYHTEYFPHVFDMKVVKEDVEQIDELSKKTLGSYVKKAVSNIDATSWTAGGGKRGKRMTDLLDKVYKRTNNVNRAVDKLAKEEVEQVDEVSRSTIAKVATARYQQAQTALKKKDFHTYTSKMRKAIKAADATTPNTGWSPEDDGKKNEEVVPEISAQEKYRQIREAKARKGLTGRLGPVQYSDKTVKNMDPDAIAARKEAAKKGK